VLAGRKSNIGRIYVHAMLFVRQLLKIELIPIS
jgi:hypothetical protein